jgi:hypothetical protein
MIDCSGAFRCGIFQPVIFQACFKTGLDCSQQILSFKVWAGIIIGKHSALHRAGHVDRAPFYHPVSCLKDAGTIIFYFKSKTVFHKTFTGLSISDGKMAGKTVYVIAINQQNGTVKPVTAITWTIITVTHGC